MFLIHADGYRKRNFSLSLNNISSFTEKNILIDKQNKNRISSSLSLSSFPTMNSFLRKVMVQLEVVLIIIKNKNKADPKRTDQNMYGYFSKSYIFSIYTVNVVHIRITSVFNCSKNAHIINESSTMVLCC